MWEYHLHFTNEESTEWGGMDVRFPDRSVTLQSLPGREGIGLPAQNAKYPGEGTESGGWGGGGRCAGQGGRVSCSEPYSVGDAEILSEVQLLEKVHKLRSINEDRKIKQVS